MDPYVFMEVDHSLSFETAAKLSGQERARLLAENPLAASTIFHRRVETLFDHFLFGKTAPFGEIRALLGRVEQQKHLSPHLHLLAWTEKTPSYIDHNAVNLEES